MLQGAFLSTHILFRNKIKDFPRTKYLREAAVLVCMSKESRERKISEQDILKLFDDANEPFMTASEIAEQLPVSRQAVNYRLGQMNEKDLVGKKKTGASSVGWWAKVAPCLDADVADSLQNDEEPAVSHDDLKAELGVE